MLAYECLIKTKSNVFPMIVHAETEDEVILTIKNAFGENNLLYMFPFTI